MNQNERFKAQPIRELEWLANFFAEHGHKEIAKEIFDQVKGLRLRAQGSLPNTEASDVIVFKRAGSDAKNQG